VKQVSNLSQANWLKRVKCLDLAENFDSDLWSSFEDELVGNFLLVEAFLDDLLCNDLRNGGTAFHVLLN